MEPLETMCQLLNVKTVRACVCVWGGGGGEGGGKGSRLRGGLLDSRDVPDAGHTLCEVGGGLLKTLYHSPE